MPASQHPAPLEPSDAGVPAWAVDVDNFVRAETDTMFARLSSRASPGQWSHTRRPTPLDQQPVIRQNRDTLYSTAVIDVSRGATVTLPETDGRYLSVMVLDQDHYVPAVFHEPGEHELTAELCGTDHVLLAARVLADPREEADLRLAWRVQDALRVQAASARPFATPVYDEASHRETRQHLLALAQGALRIDDGFGPRGGVEPVHRLLAAAAGWGGLPRSEAVYLSVAPPSLGPYALTLHDVPVDGFWSVTVYDGDGYLPRTASGIVSVNSLTAVAGPDGSVTVRFGDDDRPNTLLTPPGWSCTIRLYRPRPEVLDGSWVFPVLVAGGE